jgi:hypothetical protein
VGAFAQLKLRGAERGLRWRTDGERVAHALCRFYLCGGHVLAPHVVIASNLLIGMASTIRREQVTLAGTTYGRLDPSS